MYLHSLANRVPPQSYTQSDCWEMVQRTSILGQLEPRYAYLLERLLKKPNGIAKRHFAAEDVEQLFTRSPEQLNHEFQRAAPKLAGEALSDALERGGLRALDLDALVICTCTGYLCPGVSSYVAEDLGLRSDCFLQDLVGLGCGAAVPSLRNAAGLIAANPSAKVGVIAVEICSAAFYTDNDAGVLVSLCLFADGASASIWSGEPPKGGGWGVSEFATVHQPENRELLRFVNHNGFLRNKLHISVPTRAGEAVHSLYDQRTSRGEVIAHAGGRDVIEALRGTLPGQKLVESEVVLREYGNMSSPSVMFALEERLKQSSNKADLWLTSFGAGFAAHSCALGWSEGT
ncbi:type III polyketide synthase [Cerasicoccus arenae]|uniref:Chalcone synthase n=1 Tax=Cerasicoccus arenae TaxID=424488 RepID=A0A8J3DG33_9BACT|nr:3-oxoacyl-[acyl-carrier-protein] synthase III C-terminal domain-containing protein [Cerasicoccus arenae]MBK1859491.1 stilbene synthase [Cerasicoccus arenae]GHB94949.1 chalcone synthase [Cerasicoccus arenae]